VYVLIERAKHAEPFFSGEMIGRKQELDRLTDFYSPLCAAGMPVCWLFLAKQGLVRAGWYMNSKFYSLRGSDTLWAICQADEILRAPLNHSATGYKIILGRRIASLKRAINVISIVPSTSSS